MELEEVVEVYTVYGVYDLIAKLEAESMKHIKTAVFQKIRLIGKIRSTMTMFVAESKDPPTFLESQAAKPSGREPTTQPDTGGQKRGEIQWVD